MSKSVVWAIIVCFLIVLFSARIFAAWFYDGLPVVTIAILLLLCCGLLYVSFLIEGIILAAAKIEEYDKDSIARRIVDEYGPADTINTTLLFVKEKISDILVGQPVIAIAITLAFGTVIDEFGLRTDPVAKEAAGLPHLVIALLSSALVSGIIATAIIYWASQLLPQSLGKRNAVEFMRLPGATVMAHSLVRLSQVGIGTPSEWLARLAPDRFNRPIDLPIGDGRIFEALCKDFGYFVSKRIITIRPDDTFIEVTDETTYEYIDHRPDIRHSCRLGVEQFNGAIDFSLIAQEKRSLERASLAPFELDLSEIIQTDQSAERQLRSISTERIYVIESSIADNQPLTTRAVYKRDPFTTLRSKKDNFVFDVGVPTKEIQIRLEGKVGVVINDPPTLDFRSEVSRYFPTVRPLQRRGSGRPERDGEAWVLRYTHPPFCAEMQFTVDAREAMASHV
jgi:hypothetical protein